MLAGYEKVLEKRFDCPQKSWDFFSVKVWEPCIWKFKFCMSTARC